MTFFAAHVVRSSHESGDISGEEAGLIAALKSAETRVLSHDDVMDRATKLVGG